MRRIYSTVPPAVKPAPLDDRALLAIGRLVRAFAEIEDVITLFIGNLSRVTEANLPVLLGQTPISKRVAIVEYLAGLGTNNALEAARTLFNDDFYTALRCRNAVAHGVLLGLTENGDWAFLTSKTLPPLDGSAIQEVLVYPIQGLEALATAAERAIPRAEQLTNTQARRQERYERPLIRHHKGQPQRKRASKPAPPPSPSQA